MKIKKKILYIIAFLLFFICIGANQSKAGYLKLNNLDFQAQINADGSMVPSEKRSTGERLYAERYEPVSRKFGKKKSLQKNTAEKEMIQNVIKQAPSKVPTIPKKGI